MFDRLIRKYLTTPVALKYIGSIVRHALTFVSGLLVAWAVDADKTTQFVSTNYDVLMGIVAYLLAQGMSLAEKKQA